MSRIFKKFLPEPTARKELTIDEIIVAWNEKADQYNQWESLDADEMVNFVLSVVNANALPARRPLGDHAESYSDALRSLASYVGCGGYNADDPIDANVFEEKIRYGIDLLIASQSKKPISDEDRQRLETLERICEGLTQDHIDGGFTVTGLRKYAKGIEEDIKRLKSDNQNLIDRNALLRQRPDLPVDRITAHERLVELQAARKPLTEDDIEAVYDEWNKENHKLGSLDGMDSFARAIEAKIREQSKPQSNAI
jgi:hypothetical protein